LTLPRFKGRVSWVYAPGHSLIPGNDRADQIAVGFSQRKSPRLFSGEIADYSLSAAELADLSPRRAAPSKRSKQPALYYLSLLGNVPMRHSTWAECEARVKGKPGAKYKKAISEADAAQTLREGGG